MRRALRAAERWEIPGPKPEPQACVEGLPNVWEIRRREGALNLLQVGQISVVPS